jgi:hypothetical protein
MSERWDASNAVRLCDRCELESGVGAGADAGDRACSVCGQHSAPNVYVGLAAHEAALAAARQVDDAMVKRAGGVISAWMADPSMGGPFDAVRAALLAALTVPEPEEKR